MTQPTTTYYYQTPATNLLRLETNNTDKIILASFTTLTATSTRSLPTNLSWALDDYFLRKIAVPTELYVFPDHLPPFTKQILRVIEQVSFGQTITYTELAKQAGNQLPCVLPT